MVPPDVVPEALGVFCIDEIQTVESESVTSRKMKELRAFSARNATSRIARKEDRGNIRVGGMTDLRPQGGFEAPRTTGAVLALYDSWNSYTYHMVEPRGKLSLDQQVHSSVYKYFSSEVFAVVPFLIGPPGIYVSNLDVAHQILGNGRSALTFVKSPSNPFLLESNIIYSQGDVWRKHRRVLGQAFHNTLYADVWAQTVRAYHDMTATEDWRKRDVVEIPVVQNLTFKLATLIIGQCGFGFPFDWASQAPLPDGYISIQESIRVVTSNAALLTSPKWMQRLPLKVFEKVSKARDEVMRFLEYQVAERRAALSGFPDDSEERSKDMFSLLVGANEAESEKVRMSDEEVVGNIFAMLFAGNETTAYAIAAALGCVSLHQDIQDEALKQIEEVVGYTHDPTVDDYPRLTKVLCIFFEAVRMFPVAHVILREAGEDTTLTIPNPVGEAVSKTIPILKGTKIIVDMVGIQYNPRYFDEPEKFKPSRWEGVSPDSEAFTAFGFGSSPITACPRTCIGRKFAIVEAVCWLTMVLRDWRVEPLLRPGETEEMWAQRALDARAGITLYVSDIPVRFYGITTQQTFTYFKLNSAHDTTTLRLQIAFLWLLDGIHIAFITHSVYSCAAWSTTSLEAVRPVWSISAQVFIMTFSDFLVRGIFASRVWIVSRKNVFMVVPIVRKISFSGLKTNKSKCRDNRRPYPRPWSRARVEIAEDPHLLGIVEYEYPAMYSNLASGVAADLSIAVALVFWLLKSRTGFKRTDSLLNTMMVYAVNTGLLTTICGFTSLVTVNTESRDITAFLIDGC
ncbi:hypothetical protein EYR38_009142 [Pleurotus pulmonarius]|nr:hypothetical protein EYR38_009142 [Pleurotus pulmonarius]